MAKTELTKQAERFLYMEYVRGKIGVYGCFEVTFGVRDVWSYGKRERVDFMTYNTEGIIKCYEIKVSESDFNSDAATSFVGHYNYYVMTVDLYQRVKSKIPVGSGIGVILFDQLFPKYRIPQKAKKQRVAKGTEVNIIEAMLKSLHREQYKFYQIQPYWGNLNEE